jgi:hypothetical protein
LNSFKTFGADAFPLSPLANRMEIQFDNGLYDVVECESNIEKEVAENLSTRPEIKLFFKLPD